MSDSITHLSPTSLQKTTPLVVITRAYDDALDFAMPLEAKGWSVAGIPCIDCQSVTFFSPPLEAYQWLVFTSRWGVLHYLQNSGAIPPTVRTAVVGQRTQQLLEQHGYQASLVAEDGTSLSLANALLSENTSPQNILWPCGNHALTHWHTPLTHQGWGITPVVVYHTQQCSHFDDDAQQLLSQATAIAFTSPSCVDALMGLFATGSNSTVLANTQLWAIGPTTQQHLLQVFGRCNGVAVPHTLVGLASSIHSAP